MRCSTPLLRIDSYPISISKLDAVGLDSHANATEKQKILEVIVSPCKFKSVHSKKISFLNCLKTFFSDTLKF